MPAKKAAKKSAKKAAKKSPGHHGKHHEGKDLRKAYEHLGRLSALEPSLPAVLVAQLKKLTELAQVTLHAGEQKSAADLLRAGEHLAFGSLASTAKATGLGEELEAAINAEYEHLVDKADEHWIKHEDDRPDGIEELYESMAVAAQAAFHKGAYRRALEFVRGAEALAHVRGGGPPLLDDGGKKKPRKLKA
jgi:hypothetical protein